MTLIKSKPKNVIVKRQIRGPNHKVSHRYAKAYWPYLPVFIILGLGAGFGAILPNFRLAGPNNLSRIQSATNISGRWLEDLVIALTVVLAAWLVIRHFKRLKVLAVKSEELITRHFLFDILLALLISSGVILATHG